MFTGLVEEIGSVRRVEAGSEYRKITVDASRVLDDLALGDSISVDGACQTVTDIDTGGFAVETLATSLQKTTLGRLARGSQVNLERAVTPQSRFGGHLVQGHVDGLGRISGLRRRGHNVYLEVILPDELARYCISEGSVALDGTSLTIAELRGTRITMNIIPTTWDHTVLRQRSVGDHVNVEVDMMARYAERLLGLQGESR
jgi:riboflavin synthase